MLAAEARPALARRVLLASRVKELELAGVAHEQLRNAPEAMEFVFDRLASVLAEQQAIAAQRWAEILAVLAVSSMSGEQ